MKHVPNEWSEPFEEVLRLKEPKSRTLPGAPEAREGNHASSQDYGSGKRPSEGLVLVAPFDGIGGARRALEVLGIEPALYLSMDTDSE